MHTLSGLPASGTESPAPASTSESGACRSGFEGVVTMPKTKTRLWDPADHLATAEDMAAYLEAALADGDAALIAAALGDLARAKGMSQIARVRRPLRGGEPRVCNHPESHRGAGIAVACITKRCGRLTTAAPLSWRRVHQHRLPAQAPSRHQRQHRRKDQQPPRRQRRDGGNRLHDDRDRAGLGCLVVAIGGLHGGDAATADGTALHQTGPDKRAYRGRRAGGLHWPRP